MDYNYFINKWKNEKSFKIESDKIKEKYYIYTEFPMANQYGFQNLDIRGLIIADVYSRYNRMNDKNVFFPLGFHTLSKSSFVESKKLSNYLNDDLANIMYNQLKNLGIGINDNKLIDLRHDEYLANLQQAFIDLYNKGYIEYKNKYVYYDKAHEKIFDNITVKNKKLPIIDTRCFVLKIKDIKDKIINSINNLDAKEEIKNELISYLGPKRIMDIDFLTSNGSTIHLEIPNPEFMAGISFIFINPEKVEITNYLDSQYYNNVFSYLDGDGSLFSFTGVYATNPLTGKDIPLFISTMYDEAFYIGNPQIDEEDMALALENSIETPIVVKDDKLINSDFLDGLTFSEANEKIFEAFLDAEICKEHTIYLNDEINLSSIDNFGPLFPFLEDKETKNIKSLEGHLPYAFSDKLRPILADNVDIVGDSMNGTINNLFTEGMVPILSILYDPIGSIVSIFSNEALDLFYDFGSIKYSIVSKHNLLGTVFMPIVLSIIINNEIDGEPLKIEKVDIYDDIFDENNLEFKRSNNNLIDFDSLLKEYGPEAIRYYIINDDIENQIIFNEDKLKFYKEKINKLEKNLLKESIGSSRMDYLVFNLIKDVTYALNNKNIKKYIKLIDEFIDEYLNEINLSDKECIAFIKLISPILPFVAEYIYKERFNGKYSILNEAWPE